MKKISSIDEFMQDESFCRFCLQPEPEDLIAWGNYLENYPENAGMFYEAKRKILLLRKALNAMQHEEGNTLTTTMDGNFHNKNSIPRIRRAWLFTAIAATLLLFFLTGLWGIRFWEPRIGMRQGNESTEQVYGTSFSEHRELELPDGSRIILNANSTLSLAKGFNHSNRNVTLEGEAFFDIHKNTGIPFIIHTDALDVRVVGTTFNIKAYPNESRITASLIQGSIEATIKKGRKEKISMKPNDKLIVHRISDAKGSKNTFSSPAGKTGRHTLHDRPFELDRVVLVGLNDEITETLWTNQKLAFHNEPLSSIALTLQRWFNVKIEIIGDRLGNRTYTGTFNDDESVENILNALRISGPFSYSRTASGIIIE